ncbi:MAG: HAMP domain-containing histidine kinase, partial [Anaerolineales bacterium]|nr:HAMP domain-containing histidine kinase [Anaerolineales bacterium]
MTTHKLPTVDGTPLRKRVTALLADRIAYAHINPDLTIASTSDNFLELLNLEQEVVGRPLTEQLDEFAGTEEVLHQLLNGRVPLLYLEDVNRQTADDHIIYLDFRIYPLDPKHPQLGLLFLLEEVTKTGQLTQRLVQERNQLRLTRQQLAETNAELKQLNRLKSYFLSMAAHDLRTPLSVIRGYADLLLMRPTMAESFKKEYLQTIVGQSLWLNRLIQDILDLDQLEQGQLTIEKAPLDLRLPARDLAKELKPLLEAQEVNLALNLPAEPLYYTADYNRIKQILYNLVGNSIKFVQANDIITIALNHSADQRHIIFQVSDTGPGIEPEKLPYIFDLYYKADKKAKVSGTGLGLYIVQNLVEAHAGTITVDSVLDE